MGLKKLMFDRGITQREMAKIIDCTQSEVSFFCNGKRKLGLRHLTALENYFGKDVINKYALNVDESNTVVEVETTTDIVEDDNTQAMAIPMVTDVVLSQRGVDIKHYIEKNGSELQSIDPHKLFEGAEFAVEMFKDSMAPDIMAGDKVILQFLPKDAKLQSGAMYFINSIPYADVVRDVFIDGDIATLKARNKRYGDIVLNIKTDILRVANVLGIYRNTFSSSYAQLDELRERKDAQMDKMLDMMKTQSEQQDKLIDYITKTK
jgi:transcriptional regulator with XRE-family HTH domain